MNQLSIAEQVEILLNKKRKKSQIKNAQNTTWRNNRKQAKLKEKEELEQLETNASPLRLLLQEAVTSLNAKNIPVNLTHQDFYRHWFDDLDPWHFEVEWIHFASNSFGRWNQQFQDKNLPKSASGRSLFPFGYMCVNGQNYTLLHEVDEKGEVVPVEMAQYVLELKIPKKDTAEIWIQCFMGIYAPVVQPAKSVQRRSKKSPGGVTNTLEESQLIYQIAFGTMKPEMITTNMIYRLLPTKEFYATPEEVVSAAVKLFIDAYPLRMIKSTC